MTPEHHILVEDDSPDRSLIYRNRLVISRNDLGNLEGNLAPAGEKEGECCLYQSIDTTGRVRVIDYNIPITIGGVNVTPGDLVFADLDGIIVIPRAAEKEAIDRVLDRVSTENAVRRELAEGTPMSDVWSKYGVL